MASIQEKVKNGKIVSFRFRACLGRDENGKQVFRTKTWIPNAGLTKAKSRKAATVEAAAWETEVMRDYLLEQQKDSKEKERITLSHFVNDIWLPLAVDNGEHRPTTIAMYKYTLDVIMPWFADVPLQEMRHSGKSPE